jgi:hypothetical protein
VLNLVRGQAEPAATVSVYQKHMKADETLRFGRWGVIVF